MNNNINFDPVTGQPIQNEQPQFTTEPSNTQQPVENFQAQIADGKLSDEMMPTMEPINQPLQETSNEQNIQPQDQLHTIPVVGQNQQDFINNSQTVNQEKSEEKKEGISITFVIILFVIMLVAIYFLFPLLSKYI